jgi:hypothetical protein
MCPAESRTAYTEEDNKYLADFIQWQLRVDPKATKNKICKELGRRVRALLRTEIVDYSA